MKTTGLWAAVLTIGIAGCAQNEDISDSEVATSVVSGALNSGGGSVAYEVPKARRPMWQRALEALSPIRLAHAVTWSCTGGTLDPLYTGPARNPYTLTPVSCSVTWAPGETASAKWSTTFELSYGASCDPLHERLREQAAGCAVTRTTGAGGNTRTITGPQGNAYAINHDTNGAGTGWDASVSPAPTNDGVTVTCATDGCTNGTLVIAGSHLTGTVEPKGRAAQQLFDHTVSTGAQGLTLSGPDGNRVVSGSVTVQHNLAKYTATATFNAVTFGDPSCCYPTSGNVTTTFSDGVHAGKTETLTFGASCGDATLVGPNGNSAAITLTHCL